VEHRMLAHVGGIARSRNLVRVDVPFIPSGKNRPAAEFLQSVAAAYEQAGEAGVGLMYRIPAEYAAGIAYHPPEQAPVASSALSEALGGPKESGVGAPPPSMTKAADLGRIARELSRPEQILAQVRGQSRTGAAAEAAYVAPRTPLERELARLWAELLKTPKVGVHDNFFDLGGHSLLAVQLLSRVREQFQADLSLNVVFAGEFTVAELAKAIEMKEIEQAGAEEYEAILKELEGLSEEEVRALIEQEERSLRPDQP
jgi:acyl carrier protein